MNIISIKKCVICSEFNGSIVSPSETSYTAMSYCRCQPEGWEECTRHKNNVRRRHRSVRILNDLGDRRYFGVYAMMAPCRKDTCFTPSLSFLEDVRLDQDTSL